MDEVIEWLRSLGLEKYAPQFAENRIDFSILADLTEQDAKDLGLVAIGDRRKLMRAIAQLKAPLHVTADAAEAPKAPASVAATRPAQTAAAERRHLTVMFCDIVGSTALAAKLDPEDMREVVRAYQGACATVIAKYEGFVAQYLGDGVMAYFGYPQAHEDDAERAVRAGLDLVSAVAKLDTKTKVEVRVGIATGLVVVGDLIGEHAAKERAVTGETPNLAARLQGLAAPGSIVVSAATRRLLGGMFELRELGSQAVKGLDAPVQAFAVAGVRSFESRFEARAGGLTGFVGREEEAEHLLARKKLAWQGRGQVVLLSGEAGIGKSRLTAWLAQTIAAEPHTRLRYQCTPHHRDSALYPVIATLERAAGIAPDDAPAVKLDKLEALLALAALDTQAVAPLFAALLAIPSADRYPALGLSPAQLRQRTLAAMHDQIEALARQRPVLMIHEDAHWADATSLEHLDATVERIARLPVLLIVTGRPEFSPAWTGRHNVSTLALARLDKRDARALVDGVAGGAALPADVLDQIVAKTDGVPLFVEELTKAVLESGLLVEDGGGYRPEGPLPALAIPATLQDSLMARLDRSNPVKEIAQIGAAIGREFSYKLLLAVAGMDEVAVRAGLAKLEESELASRRGVPPEATYTFKHALVQDAAYESLLKSRRQTIHRRIAKALRDRFPVLAETEPEIIAHHFAQAGRPETAVEWWTKAGELALRRSAYAEAKSHFERSITIATGLPENPANLRNRVRLELTHGNVLLAMRGYNAIETRSAFVRAAELATRTGNLSDQLTASWGVWVGYFVGGDMFRAKELAAEFLREAEARLDGPEAMVGHSILGRSFWGLGEYLEARRHLERALAAYDFERDAPLSIRFGFDIAVVTMLFLAHTLWPLGDTARACNMSENAVAHALRTNHPNTIANAHVNKGMFEAIRNNPHDILRHAVTTIAIGCEHKLQSWLANGHLLRGWALWYLGDDEEAGERQFNEGRLAILRTNSFIYDPLRAVLWSKIEASKDPRAAIAIVDQTLSETVESGRCWFNAELHRRRGELLLQLSPRDASGAETAFHQALAVSRAQQTRSFELRASLDLARLYRATGRDREARDLLGPALVGFTETPELPEIGEAQRLLAELGW